jgi:hypothetical protein
MKMKIHLFKSTDVAKELFTEVVNLLQAVPGNIGFEVHEISVIDFDKDVLEEYTFNDREAFETKKSRHLYNRVEDMQRLFPHEVKTASWESLFVKCDNYRKQNKIPNNEFVFLLTDVPNENNWFSSLEPSNPYNGFIHTGDWDYFIDCPPAFPIAYEVISLILFKHCFNSMDDVEKMVHHKPIGCVNDMCKLKSEIILKLRTADVCPRCMEKIKESMPIADLFHALDLMESFRVKMLFSQNFRQNVPVSKLRITKKHKIYLPGFSNLEICLRPLEKILYFLFLKHPEGIMLSFLCNYRDELNKMYEEITLGNHNEMRGRINQLVDVTDNSASEKISLIKKEFTKKTGDTFAQHYIIKGGNGEHKKIALDRQLVEFD